MNLYPAILTDSKEELQRQLSLAQNWPMVTTVQIDIIDGLFADNLTLTPLDLVEVDWGRLKVDFHLMTEEPDDYLLELAALKTQLPVRAVIGQIEKMSRQLEFVREVHRLGWLAGLSLDLATADDEIKATAWAELEIVQLMAVPAGHQGQELDPQIFSKLTQLTTYLDQSADRAAKVEIIVDGGVKLANAGRLLAAGADGLALGSCLWTAADPEKILQQLTTHSPSSTK